MGVRTATAAIFLTLALSGPGALAQLAGSDQTTPPAAVAPQAFPSTPELSASLMAPTVARELRRLALLELRAMDTPAGDDYLCTEFLLSLAAKCRADDVEQLRRRVEAAFNAGDSAKVEALSRQLLTMDPGDTRTQLRLIAAKLTAMQTVEARLAAIDRLLGPDGAKLDASVRSRLAVDAANFAKERGDIEGYATRIKMAAKLDGTNKEAAILLYQFFVESSDDRVGAVELMANMLYADPMDPAVYTMLRDAMLDVRAHAEAQRFQDTRASILSQLRVEKTGRENLAQVMMLWYSKGAADVLKQIEGELNGQRDEVARQRALQDPSLRTRDGGPESVRLEIDFEEARLAAAAASGDRPSLLASLGDLAITVGNGVQAYLDPNRQVGTVARTDVDFIVRESVKLLQLWRLATGEGVETAEAELAAFEQLKQDGPSDLNLLKAWIAFRKGDTQSAAALLAQTDPSTWGAMLAGELAAARGDNATATALLIEVYQAATLEPIGGYALHRAKTIDPASVAPDATGRKVISIANSIPKWFDRMCTDPRVHQTMKVTTATTSAEVTDSVMYEVTLKNISQLPLGLGSDRALSSRLLFAPALEAFAGQVHTVEPEVFELGGRLRLLPGETVTLRCEPDLGATGWIASAWCRFPTRLRWRVIQGFEPDSANAKRPGPGCAEIFTESFARRGLTEAAQSDTDMIAAIRSAPEIKVPALVYAARAALLGLTQSQGENPNPGGIAQALADRYPTWSPAARAVAMCVLPPSSAIPELAAFDLAATAEPDPVLQAVYMLTRATDEADAVLAKCLASSDPEIVKVATIHKERIANGRHTYSTRGPNLKVINPPKGDGVR
jgi:hypothetical protein